MPSEEIPPEDELRGQIRVNGWFLRTQVCLPVLLVAFSTMAFADQAPDLVCALEAPRQIGMLRFGPLPDHAKNVEVELFIKNTTEQADVLSVQHPSNIHSWEVVDQAGNLVEKSFRFPGPSPDPDPQHRGIAPQKTIFQKAIVPLKVRLYETGKEYTLRYRFWGLECERKFRVTVEDI